jgi:dihydroorotate dehydrogenase electron transfer subunit
MISKPRTTRKANRSTHPIRIPLRALPPNDFPSLSHAYSDFLRSNSNKNDVILDPFSVGGAMAYEFLRLGRRVVAIERDPVTAFFAETRLRPASLPRLTWAFEDVRAICRDELAALYATRCPKCAGRGTIATVERSNGKLLRIEYLCGCARKRLVKKPDAADLSADEVIPQLEIPFWHPTLQLATAERTRSCPSEFLNQRTNAALSIILHAVENLPETSARDVLRAAFASSLETGGSPIPPGSSGYRRGNIGREENPWYAFESAFRKWYTAKKDSNQMLKDVVIGRSFDDLAAGRANALILIGAGPEPVAEDLPEGSIDAVIGAAPQNPSAGGPYRSSVQAAWLRKAWADDVRGAYADEKISAAFRAIRRAGKAGSSAHFFIGDGPKDDLHGLLNLMEKNGVPADRIMHESPPPGDRIPGGYIIQSGIHRNSSPPAERISESVLRKKLAAAAQTRVLIHGEKTTPGKILHAFYPQLGPAEIATVSKYSIEDLLAGAVTSLGRLQSGRFIPLKKKNAAAGKRTALPSWRRIVLDGEALAAGSREDIHPSREQALRRLAREGLTAEDADALRRTLTPVDINRRRLERTAGLLRDWGKALGHPVRAKGVSTKVVIWSTAKQRTVEYTLGHREITVASRQSGSPRSIWGAVSYLNLERLLSNWCRDHPSSGKLLSAKLAFPGEISGGEDTPKPKAVSCPADWTLRVVQNTKVCDRHFLLTLELPKTAEMAYQPGQFFHIECDPETRGERPYPLTLRRPLSIHRARYPGFHPAALAWADDLPIEIRHTLRNSPSRLDFLYRVVGEGTDQLSRIRKGAFLRAIGPCGKGFSIGSERTAVIVAGGIGIAPLAALAEWLRFCGKEVVVYIGAVEKQMLSLAVTRNTGPEDDDREILDAVENEFREIGAQILTVCTDDGSIGERGLVTEMLERGIRDGCVPREGARVYACGPAGMLRAVAAIAARNEMPCEVSLEERMACGIGACYGCTVTVSVPDGSPRKQRVCREGPVFQARDIVWKD